MTIKQKKELLSKIVQLVADAEEKDEGKTTIGVLISFDDDDWWGWNGNDDPHFYKNENYPEEALGPFNRFPTNPFLD